MTALRRGSDKNGKTNQAGADSATTNSRGKTRSAVITTRCQRADGKITEHRLVGSNG